MKILKYFKEDKFSLSILAFAICMGICEFVIIIGGNLHF